MGHLQQYTCIGKQAERFELQAGYYELQKRSNIMLVSPVISLQYSQLIQQC